MQRAYCTVSVMAGLGMFLLAGCCQQTSDSPPAVEVDTPKAAPVDQAPVAALKPAVEEPVAFVAQDGEWGHIKGRVTWKPKDIPERKAINVKDNADKLHCLSKGELLDEVWVVDKKTRGLKWTIVWLIQDDVKNKAPLPIHPKLKEIKEPKVFVDQPVCAFVPHALAIREGQILVAKNSSPVSHNLKWTGAKNQNNITVPAGGQLEIKELVAERIPMTIECGIHPWMNGRVGIFAHPYFAVTDNDGNFEIKDAPAGKYRLVVYNNFYNGGAEGRNGQQITIPAGKTLELDIAFDPPKE
jgi:hypothetical protein